MTSISKNTAIVLAVGMVLTGSINTLVTKLADVTSAEGINGESSDFDHPYVQALGMFLGELMCLAAFYILPKGKADREEKPFPLWTFLLPALCDMTATSLMYVGLGLTYASVYQMLRGSVVIFTGIFSVIFLKKELQAYQWCGMVLVLIGLTFVGLSSVVGSSSDDNNASDPIVGDILVVCAQVIVGIQMVVEEKYLAKYNVPALKAVGLEGFFGMCGITLVIFIFYFIPGSSGGNHYESMPDALVQMYNSWIILLSMLGTVISISFFNFFGLSVTKTLGATTRMVVDSVRTFVIWAVSLAIGWQDFQYFQIIGFLLLIFGTFVYYAIIKLPFLPPPKTVDGELQQIQEADSDRPTFDEPLINEDPEERRT